MSQILGKMHSKIQKGIHQQISVSANNIKHVFF